MAITKEDELEEKKFLKKTSSRLNKIIDELKKEVKIDTNDLVEFKKLAWQDSNSFDSADIAQAKLSTDSEEQQLLTKEKYLKKLDVLFKLFKVWVLQKNISANQILNKFQMFLLEKL